MKRTLAYLCAVLLLCCFFGNALAPVRAYSAEGVASEQTVSLRVLSTGDLHGQAVAFNYETLQPAPLTGLSKVAALIASAKKAVPKGNSLLLDAGDFLFDFSSEFFYDNDQAALTPILAAMKLLNYDAITMGNHEFDYPMDYVTNQMKMAGMTDKITVSNMIYAVSGASVYAPSLVVTKSVEASDGKKYKLRVGIVGATKQGLSSRKEYYGSSYATQDIYKSVSKEAKRLKDKGEADIVIALVHGGIGLADGSDTAVHPGSRLAHLAYIDAVITSHSHEEFPSKVNNYTASYFSGIVDWSAGLVYNTPIVAAGKGGAALGIIDLTLQIGADGRFKVIGGHAATANPTAKTKESVTISNAIAPYIDTISTAALRTQYPLAKGLTYTSADAIVEDSDLYQLINNAQLEYAHSYVGEHFPEYADLPVVAAASNLTETPGGVIISDAITPQNLAQVLSWSSVLKGSGYAHISKTTGAYLRNWLEYNACVYATVGAEDFSKYAPIYYSTHKTVSPLLTSEFYDDRSIYYIFDGISYTIDISEKPRYGSNGKVISTDRHRIKNLTYMGKPIKDDQEIVIIYQSQPTFYKYPLYSGQNLFANISPWITTYDIVLAYLDELKLQGRINERADHNWKIIAPDGFTFAIGFPQGYTEVFKTHKWMKNYAFTNKNAVYSAYYKGSFGAISKLAQSTNVTLAADTRTQTGQPIGISVYAQTASGVSITDMRWLKGVYKTTTNKNWDNAAVISDGKFSVTANGKYTVKTTDSTGKVILRTVLVANYKAGVVRPPTAVNITNRKTQITGTCRPSDIVHAVLADGTALSATGDAKGEYVIDIPYQPAFSKVRIFASDETGRVSASAYLDVRRSGPDVVSVSSDTTVATSVFAGKAEALSTVYIRYGSIIYVGKGQTGLYKKSEFYNESYRVIERNLSTDANGFFTADIQNVIKEGKSVWIYAVGVGGATSMGMRVTIGGGAGQ